MRISPILLVALLTAGCLGGPSGATPRSNPPADVGYDPGAVHVEAVRLENHTVRSWDNATDLAVVVYVPETQDTTPLGEARFPLVVFMHGWGGSKESYLGRGSLPAPPAGEAPEDPSAGVDRLAQFARAGMVALAFDARGHGDSGGQAAVAGPAEQADLDFLIDWANARFPTSGRIGLIGQSYGAGQALLGMTRNPQVTAVVSQYGWADLAEGLIPGDVPKLAWGNALYGYGAAGARGNYDPMIHRWYSQALLREDLQAVRSEMGSRSSFGALGTDTTPLLLCQGLEETLFPQQDLIAQRAAGFTRSYYYTGGHSSDDPGCWARSLAWFQHFLGGFDTQVDGWPILDTIDANGVDRVTFATWPQITPTTYRLRNDELSTGPPSAATFTIEQRVVGNPVGEPDGVFDQSGLPRPLVPAQSQQDPGALLFTTQALQGENVLLGGTRLVLHVQDEGAIPFQVVGSLYRITSEGRSQLLGRAAFAALEPGDLDGGSAALHFPWIHAKLAPGDKIQLKLGANDEAAWYPLAAVYSVTFDGASELSLPIRSR